MATLELRIAPPHHSGQWYCEERPLGNPIDFTPHEKELTALSEEFNRLFEQRGRPYVDPNLLPALGRRLFDLVFAPVRDALAAVPAGENAILLRCANSHLLNLPWEFVDLQPDLPLGCDPKWAFLRVPIPTGPLPPVSPPDPGPVRLQFLAAAPTNSVPLDFEREEDAMLKAIGTLSKEVIVLPFAETGGINELADLVAEHRPHVVHLSGHGIVDTNGVGHFGFEDERGHNDKQPVSELVNRVFRGAATRCVLLNACQTAKSATAGLAQKLVESGVPLVIGWAASVADDLATTFAEGFYKHLAKGESVPAAVARARQIIWRLGRKTVGQQQLIDITFALPQVYALGPSVPLYDRTAPLQEYKGPRTVPFLLGDGIQGLTEGFVGRRRVRQQLIPSLRDGVITFAVLHGMGGMGKSTLATRATNRLHETGFRYYPVKAATGDTPERNGAMTLLKLHVAIGQALLGAGEKDTHALFEDGKIPFEQRLGLAVSALCNHSAVFVLDNFEDVLDLGTRRIVHPDLSAAYQHMARNLTRGSRVIVTSRYLPADTPTDTPTVWCRSLDELIDSEFLKFLRRDVVVEGRMQRGELPTTWLAELYRTTGGVPGFLSQVRAVLQKANPDELTDNSEGDGSQLEQRRQRYYEGIFLPKLFDLLEQSAKVLCSRLAVSELPLPLDALAGLLGCDEAATELAVRNGVDYGLLVAFPAAEQPSLYHPPGLLRPWLADPERLSTDDAREAHRYLARFWRTRVELRRGNDLRVPIDIGASVCLGHARSGEDHDTHCWAACILSVLLVRISEWKQARRILEGVPVSHRNARTLLNFGSIDLNEGNYPAARDHFQNALLMFRAIDDREGESTALNNLGSICVYEGDSQTARDYFQKALVLDRATGDRAGEAGNLHQLGSIDLNEGRYPAAREHLRQALEIKRAIGDWAREATTLLSLACIDLYEGKYAAARVHFQQCLEDMRSSGNRAGVAMAQHNLGALYIEMGDYPTARRYLLDALDLQRAVGARFREAGTLHLLANLDLKEGNCSAARHNYQLTLTIRRGIGDRAGEAVTLHNLGSIDVREGNYSSGHDYFQQSLAIKRSLGDATGEAITLHSLGDLNMKEKNLSAARSLFQQALDIRRAKGDRAGEADTLHQLGTLEGNEGNNLAAREIFRKSLEIKRAVSNRAGEAATLNNLGTIHLNEGDYTAACGHYRQALEINRGIGDQSGEAANLHGLGVIGWKSGQREVGVRLVGMSFALLMTIGASDRQPAQTNLSTMLEELGISTEEGVSKLQTEVRAQYAIDKGESWVRQVLAEAG